MTKSNNDDNIDTILELENPSIAKILKCSDVQAAFRNKNKKLVRILLNPHNIGSLIDFFHKSEEFQMCRHILGLFLSPNTALLTEFVEKVNYLEKLLEALVKPKSVHRFVIGAIMQILSRALDNWGDTIFDVFGKSRKIYSRLSGCIHLPAVYHFASKLAPKSKRAATFIWVLFTFLMDQHGTGPSIPTIVQKDAVSNLVLTNLTPEQRCRTLEIICIYFHEFDEESDMYKIISQALPLMLQDASDDNERSLVFKLGMILDFSPALGQSAITIINYLNCSDLLLQYSLFYITAYNIAIGMKTALFFLYRVLSKPVNNFVLIAATKMIRMMSQIKVKGTNNFASHVNDVLVFSFQQHNLTKSALLRSFKAEFIKASEGDMLEPETVSCADTIRSVNSSRHQHYNQGIINEFMQKAMYVEQNINKFLPEYNVKLLWKSELSQMEVYYKTIEKLPHLNTRVPNPMAMLSISTKNNKPAPKSKSLLPNQEILKVDSQKISKKPVDLPVLRLDNTNSSDDDDDFNLPEIDVSETLSSISSREVPTPQPIEDIESIKEPLPKDQVPKDEIPIPKVMKIAPDSPRVAKSGNIENRPASPTFNRAPPSPIKSSVIMFSDDEDIDFVFEEEYEEIYVDEEEERKDIAIKVPIPSTIYPKSVPQVKLVESNVIPQSIIQKPKCSLSHPVNHEFKKPVYMSTKVEVIRRNIYVYDDSEYIPRPPKVQSIKLVEDIIRL